MGPSWIGEQQVILYQSGDVLGHIFSDVGELAGLQAIQH